jgi:ATP-dependent phosphoenolpyruvate carboxykinase
MKIKYTRAMIHAALSGALDHVQYERDARFNLDVPTSCPAVPADVLNPRKTWASTADYDAQADALAAMFAANFTVFAPHVPADVLNPRKTWASTAGYDAQADALAAMFAANFTVFAPHVSADVNAAGPRGHS